MIELLFYIAIFTVLFLVVINSLIFMTRSFRETVVNTDLTQSTGIMERISREIRNGEVISAISSTSLTLGPSDAAAVVTASSGIQFTLSGSNIVVYDGRGTLVGNLNSPNISVTALNFSQITTTQGTAVKIFMTVKSNHYGSVRTENFYDTIVLRGDY